ncbi:hypothetical protein SDC9_132448 [bioreactor metagenome]|uniref:Uncharacterized protein n=1 Tax=bioreactor metagenome TaxID=1076179 RepID=A0A645D8I8_9ZZZZ
MFRLLSERPISAASLRVQADTTFPMLPSPCRIRPRGYSITTTTPLPGKVRLFRLQPSITRAQPRTWRILPLCRPKITREVFRWPTKRLIRRGILFPGHSISRFPTVRAEPLYIPRIKIRPCRWMPPISPNRFQTLPAKRSPM